MIDPGKLIRALEKAMKQSQEYGIDEIIVPLKETNMIITLLKEHQGIVRCDECTHGHMVSPGFYICERTGSVHDYEWFCADNGKGDE